MTTRLLFAAIALSACTLAGGWYAAGQMLPAVGTLGLGLLWALAEWRCWRAAAPLGLTMTVLVAVWGEFAQINAQTVLTAVILGLAAWDLSDFAGRLRLAAPEDDIPALERRHFLRLGVVIGLGFSLSTGALWAQDFLRFTFEAALVLVLVGLWGLARLFTRLLDQEHPQ